MWALRRASSNPLKFRGFSIAASRVCSAKSDILPKCSGATIAWPSQDASETCLLQKTYTVSSKFFMIRRSLSSQVGAESSDSEDGLEDGFSELEIPVGAEKDLDQSEDELISEPELSDDEDVGESSEIVLELSDVEADSAEKRPSKQRVSSELFKAIAAAPSASVHSVLNKWQEEGKDLSGTEIQQATLNLRKHRMYLKALLLSEWVEANKVLDFNDEKDYAARLDLIAKVRGLQKAEMYTDDVPESFRGEVLYRTLLANCVSAKNMKKGKEIFNKMKELGFPITAFSCNQLLLLYQRFDKKKIADILLLMEKNEVKPTPSTYRILIDTKGRSSDLAGMDQIFQTMKGEGIEPDIRTQAIMARHYASGGLKEKAEEILKEMEGGNLAKHRWVCRSLLFLYAELGNADEVRRVWKVCESNPRLEECFAAIEAMGKVNEVEAAEDIFDKMQTKWKKLNSRYYAALLKVYASNKMLDKGKNLVKRMADNGMKIGPYTWDALVKLYVEVGEVEKADSFLRKASQQSKLKPMCSSYMAILEQYSKRGDVHNAEKIFHTMKQYYAPRIRQYQNLMQSYINAKQPAYGIRERMKADNVFPMRTMAAQLVRVDAFRKNAVSDLLD